MIEFLNSNHIIELLVDGDLKELPESVYNSLRSLFLIYRFNNFDKFKNLQILETDMRPEEIYKAAVFLASKFPKNNF